MKNIGRTDQLSIIGLLGLTILIAAAYFKPVILQNTQIDDFTLNGMIAKVGALFGFVGFLSFFHDAPQSYKKPISNILRITYIIVFIAIAYCSESNWECFV